MLEPDGLDDIIAGLGFPQAEPDAAAVAAAPPETPPPSAVAAESEQASDAPAEPDSSVATEQPTDDDPEALKARLAEIEAELQARQQAEAEAQQAAEQRRLYEEQLAAWKAQQAEEQRSQQFADELANVDPQWRDAYQQVRGGLLQQRDQAWQDSFAARHGLTALVKAAESVLDPAQFETIANLAGGLVTLRSETEMDQTLAQQRQAYQAQRQRDLEKDREIAELRLRIDAMSRPPQADAVDASGSGGTGRADWQSATDFDTFFAGLEGTLPWAQ